jgi:5-methylthioadenosine/S-adenosylhomocysteine deaminase
MPVFGRRPARRSSKKGSVLVRQGRIVKVGRFTARADVTVDADGQLLMPGLIQGHIHLCQTIFRGAGEDMPLLPWLRHVVWPLEAAHMIPTPSAPPPCWPAPR